MEFKFSTLNLHELLSDLVAAEEHYTPGPAKQAWVIANQIARHSTSPPPVWVWLLVALLERLIPELLTWIKTKYGDDWPAKLRTILKDSKLPWL